MKKLQQTLIIGALLLPPLAITQVAGAELPEGATCPTGFRMEQTGPGSKNTCVSETTYTCTIDNDNKIVITNESTQDAFSSEVTLSDNTGGGDAQSGSVENTNGGNFYVTVTNPSGDIDPRTCAVVATIAPIIPEEKPVPTEVVPAPEVKAAPKLATTAGDNTVAIVAGVLGATTVTLAGLKTASWLRRR